VVNPCYSGQRHFPQSWTRNPLISQPSHQDPSTSFIAYLLN
jgi:hypothetical protein